MIDTPIGYRFFTILYSIPLKTIHKCFYFHLVTFSLITYVHVRSPNSKHVLPRNEERKLRLMTENPNSYTKLLSAAEWNQHLLNKDCGIFASTDMSSDWVSIFGIIEHLQHSFFSLDYSISYQLRFN